MAYFRALSGSGGSESETAYHYTTNITFNDNTTYHYVAEGKFINLTISRGSVPTAPVIQVFKKVNGNYEAITNAVSTANGTTHINTNESPLTKAEIYIKKNSGSTFTSTSIDVTYVV